MVKLHLLHLCICKCYTERKQVSELPGLYQSWTLKIEEGWWNILVQIA